MRDQPFLTLCQRLRFRLDSGDQARLYAGSILSVAIRSQLEFQQRNIIMRNQALFAGVLIAVLNGLLFVPGFEPYGRYLAMTSLALGLWLVLKVLVQSDPTIAEEPEIRPTPKSKLVVPAVPKNTAEAEVIAVVGSLQSKGRFVDFLMDDIGKYSDAQVGAAARVVHQGCKSAFDELFTVEPVASEKEGSTISVPAGAGESYRLSGSVSGEGPFTGKLVHKGWKASRVNLPRVIRVEDGQLPPIAPAQVEVK